MERLLGYRIYQTLIFIDKAYNDGKINISDYNENHRVYIFFHRCPLNLEDC